MQEGTDRCNEVRFLLKHDSRKVENSITRTLVMSLYCQSQKFGSFQLFLISPRKLFSDRPKWIWNGQ
jgi:hypothetical protein